jgi:Tfp pilus assembly protein PilF
MRKNFAGLCVLSVVLLAGCTGHQTSSSAGVASGGSPVGPNTLNVADAAIAGGDPTMALSVSQSVLEQHPDDADAMIHEGDAYYALGRCPASEAAYRRALGRRRRAGFGSRRRR